MRKLFLGFFLLLSFQVALGQTIPWPKTTYYNFPWVDSSSNSLQITSKSLLKPFFQKLQNTHKKKVQILHINDFHVQHNLQTQLLISAFQKTFGYGGTGFIFPYSITRIAEIAPYKGYKSFHYGKWVYAKSVSEYPILPTGINFLSAKTFDPLAQFKFYFHKELIKPSYKRVHIFCKRIPTSFDIKLKSRQDSVKIDVYNTGKDSLTNEIVIDLKSMDNTLSFELIKKESIQESFELYGLYLENIEDQGIVYHSVGSVSLGYTNLLKNSLIDKELSSTKPDLIILELGKYDFFSNEYDPYIIKKKIIKLIDNLKNLPFKPLILLVSPQDQFKGKLSSTDYAKFSLLLMEIAKTEKVAYLDWYRISGGHLSMNQWIQGEMAKPQGNELLSEGYFLKTNLFMDAFRQTAIKLSQKRDSLGSTFIPILDSSYLLRIDTTKKVDTTSKAIVPQNTKTEQPVSQLQSKWIIHIVKSGETVWSIAENYDVQAVDIKKWNNLRSYSLKKGKKLKLYTSYPDGKKIEVDYTNTKGDKSPVNPISNSKHKKFHKVKRGDTLFSISRKYNIGVDELKELNGMHSNDIAVGKKIRVK